MQYANQGFKGLVVLGILRRTQNIISKVPYLLFSHYYTSVTGKLDARFKHLTSFFCESLCDKNYVTYYIYKIIRTLQVFFCKLQFLHIKIKL